LKRTGAIVSTTDTGEISTPLARRYGHPFM
jgi:hypothetical protein